MAESEREAKFTFQILSGKSFQSIEGKDNQEYLLKWSMKGRIKAQTFSFDQVFQNYQKDHFVLNFFQDPQVQAHLQVLSSNGKWVNLGMKATSVRADPLTCTELSMSYFDRLQEHDIIKEGGRISKCFDEFYEDFIISDELRKCLLLEDSDNYDIFSDGDRKEFLFSLFRHVCLGGSVCQFEDNIQPYLDVTKAIYKDLISVQKDEAGVLHVTSLVYKISASTDGVEFYPAQEHEQNFAYLVVDPLRRNATVLYHNFGVSEFDP